MTNLSTTVKTPDPSLYANYSVALVNDIQKSLYALNAAAATAINGIFIQDLLVNRPAPGVAGRFFYRNDQNVMDYDTGAGWVNPFPAYVGDTSITANVVTLSIQGITALVEGMTIFFKLANNITGSATVNVNSLGAKTLIKNDGNLLANGDYFANDFISATFNSGGFFVVNSERAGALAVANDLGFTPVARGYNVVGSLTVGWTTTGNININQVYNGSSFSTYAQSGIFLTGTWLVLGQSAIAGVNYGWLIQRVT